MSKKTIIGLIIVGVIVLALALLALREASQFN